MTAPMHCSKVTPKDMDKSTRTLQIQNAMKRKSPAYFLGK